MQGSHEGPLLHDQTYRAEIEQLLRAEFPDVEIYDPFANHQESIGYDEDLGREVFFSHNRLCAEVEVVIAFVPEASMGTAVEMWEAYRHGRTVITVSPLLHNWCVRFLSHAVYATIEEFQAALISGEVSALLERRGVSMSRSHDCHSPSKNPIHDRTENHEDRLS